MADNLRPTQAVQLYGNILGGQKVSVTREILAGSVDNTFFVAHRISKVAAVSYAPRVTGTGGAATIQIQRCQGTEAPGSGDDLITPLDLVGVTDTVQDATLTTTSAHLILAIGDRLVAEFAGTKTNVVGNLTVEIEMMKQDDSLPA